MKKVIILIIVVFFLTGCNAEYNLEITADSFKETINLYPEDSNENAILSEYNFYEPAFFSNPGDVESGTYQENVEYYNKSYVPYGSFNALVYSYTFRKSNFSDASGPLSCYGEIIVKENGGKMMISTGKNNDCFNIYPPLDSLTINIKLDYNVSSHNADKVNGNVYTWNVTRDNYNNKAVQIEYVTTDETSSTKEEDKEDESNIKMAVLAIVLGITGIIVVIILKTKGKKL